MTNGKSALVILGAGASYDLMSATDAKRSANKEFRPPLVDQIFTPRPSFQPILTKYPGAGVLAETIRRKVPPAPLEAVLREIAGLPGDNHQAKLFREVPLFLQELFGEVSDRYAGGRQPPNLSHLINCLLGAFEHVALITTNYDLFIEQVLSVAAIGGPIEDIGWYIRSDRWILVKLHGSVNWGRQLLNHPQVDTGKIDLGLLAALDLDPDPTPVILPNHKVRVISMNPYYPALVAPIEGKYGFVCPPEHVDALAKLLPHCERVLFIGQSGRDQDLMDLLHEHLEAPKTLTVVGGSADDVRDVQMRLATIPSLKGTPLTEFPGGFSAFISQSGAEKFCE